MQRVRFACFAVAATLTGVLGGVAAADLHPWNAPFRMRLAQNVGWTHDDHLIVGFWIGVAVTILCAFVLGLTVRWWLKAATFTVATPEPARGGRKVFFLAWLAAAALFSLSAAPRLGLSMWDDEQHTLLDFVHGQWMRETAEDGTVSSYFMQNSWWDTTFGYRDPNNHLLYSVAARACLLAWQKIGGHPVWEFSEVPFRLPAFGAGLLGLAAWGFFARRLGMRGGALAIMLLLALHPWYVRYGSEGRGYAFVLLLLPLHLAALLQALRTGRWKSCFAATGLIIPMLWSWPGIAVPVAFLQIATLWLLWRKCRPAISRWLVSNIGAACVAGTVLMPCFLQAIQTDYEYAKGPMNARYLTNFLTHLLSGHVWFGPATEFPVAENFVPFGNQSPLLQMLSAILLAVIFAAVAVGLVSLWRGCRKDMTALRLGFLAMVAAVAVTIIPPFVAPAAFHHTHVFDWYFVWFMPVVMLLAVAGFAVVRRRRGRIPPAAVLGLFLAIMVPHLRRLSKFPVQPMRESVALMRQGADGQSPSGHRILTAHVNQMAIAYDPNGYEVTELRSDDPADPGLTNLMSMADRLGHSLFVNVGLPKAARLNYPQMMKLIDNPELFEVIGLVRAQEIGIDHLVFRYRGGMFPHGARH